MAKDIDGEWYLVDGEAVFWDGTKNRRFKWKSDPGLYEFQGVWYSWDGSNWKKASSHQLNQIEPTDDVKRIGSSAVLRFFGTALVVVLVIVALGFGWNSFINTPSIEVPAKALTASELVNLGCQDYSSLTSLDNFSSAAEIDEQYRVLAVSANSYKNFQLITKSEDFKNLDREIIRQWAIKSLQDLAVIHSFC